jgi:hypothetical protein
VTDGTVSLNLNPGWADNNVFLAIRSAGPGVWTGSREHSTIAGPVAGGTVSLQCVVR